MAKKKKPTKRKPTPVVEERSAFWPMAGSVLLILLAVFVLLGMFGGGGPLPQGLYRGVYWAVGWAGFLVPVALVTFGVAKFTSEDKQIPIGKLASVLALIASVASWFQVAFASKLPDGTIEGGHGGAIGGFIGDVSLRALNAMPASLMFLVFSVLLFCLSFGISLKSLLKVFELIKPKPTDDTDLGELKAKATDTGFKMNEGVPVEHHSASSKPRVTSLKNTAQKLAAAEQHEALTTASDPDWKLPGMDLLIQKQDKADAGDVEGNAEIINQTFANFNINVEMEGANIGPRVTQYTLKPPTGVKLTKITALENNLALDLAAHSIRMEAPIPGKRAVGIEVPNLKAATVRLSSIFQASQWTGAKSPLTFVIGKDIAGQPVLGDLAKMPHLLVAGQTGSGKSVMINDILTSMLYRNSPSDLKLILVDPKQVELKPYDDIPHLLTPVITEPEKCISALKWTVAEMERRYKALADVNRRNITEYNNLKKEEGMPYIVVVIDELADLMMMAARDVEALIVRIAQKARAVGIHLVLATQRPSVDVITGLIKANVPARIAFTTASQVDSRTIIDQIGAEKLLGMGDMLLSTADMPKPKRVQGAFITDDETIKVTDFIRMQRPPQYDDEVVSQPVQLNGKGGVVADYGGQDADDDMYREAVQAVIEGHKASTSLLQRRLRIGYGRAARLIETMEEQGIISHADGNRPREVLVSSVDEVFGGGATAEAGDAELYDENFPEEN
ncbi:DNA translocase FtsK 4TM domain-containing protein [Candidatus Saccharibacteria bacterium]|nr:DNA translocase FtsK 4TM domain-containing protein [Candidatus Saccharibacteria bacterium]